MMNAPENAENWLMESGGENLIPDLNTLYNTLTPLVQEAAQKQICIDL